ncbi:MAG: radical protein [Paenibacillaceae bacterium]|jgi:radical SAM protein with 4Fe4S-binding SPASM domain|nr:radical protein [Paenibacillaceae bacterium]
MIATDFNCNPFIVIWEVTRACALHCLHCRAEAQHKRHPGELTTEEGKRLLDEIQSMDSPIFVFTGGDPLMRDDLFELTSYGKSIGLRVSMTPSATPRVTEEAIRQASAVGLDRWAFSLDGSTAAIHDRFRGASGSFDLTMRSLSMLRKLNMPLQINTTVCVHNKHDLKRIAEIIGEMGVVMWSVFFLVPTGRGKNEDMISPEEGEEILHWLAELGERVPFGVKTTAAPFYRRVLAQRAKALGQHPQAVGARMLGVPELATRTGKHPASGEGRPIGAGGHPHGEHGHEGRPQGRQAHAAGHPQGGEPFGGHPHGGQPNGGQSQGGEPIGGHPGGGQSHHSQSHGGQPHAGHLHGGQPHGGQSPFGAGDGKAAMRAPRGVTDGSGFVFISHTGEVSPSGFLPIPCGNVREQSLASIYREHPVFTSIRNPDLYTGKCGVCDYRQMCGGSRARAYTATGDYLGSDPACAYLPPAWKELMREGR